MAGSLLYAQFVIEINTAMDLSFYLSLIRLVLSYCVCINAMIISTLQLSLEGD